MPKFITIFMSHHQIIIVLANIITPTAPKVELKARKEKIFDPQWFEMKSKTLQKTWIVVIRSTPSVVQKSWCFFSFSSLGAIPNISLWTEDSWMTAFDEHDAGRSCFYTEKYWKVWNILWNVNSLSFNATEMILKGNSWKVYDYNLN